MPKNLPPVIQGLARAFEGTNGRAYRAWVGPWATGALAVLIEVLRGTALSIPNPPAFLILAVVFSTFLGGLRSGLVSGAVAWLYIAYFFSLPDQPFRYSEENVRRVAVWAGTIPLLVVLVGSLKRKAEQAAVYREADREALWEYQAMLARLCRLAEKAGTRPEVGGVFEAVFEFARASAPCDGIFVSRFDRASGLRTCVYAAGADGEDDVSKLPPMPLSGSPASRAITTGQVVVCADLQADLAGKPVVTLGVEADPRLPQASLAVPMVVQGDVIGAVEIQSVHRNAYRSEHIAAMQMAATLAGIALQNVELLGRERQQRLAAELSEERYRELFENANDVVYSADLEGNITSINREGERLTEYSQEELLGRNMAEFIAKEFLDRSKAMLQAKLEGSSKTTYEIELITKSDRRLPLEVSSRLISLGGKPAGVQGIARDVTERRKAEEELRARESRLASIYETVADVIFVLAVEERGAYRFTSVNPAFWAVTGLPPEAVVGKLISEVIPPPSLDLVLAKYREAIEGRRTVRWEETSDYPTGRLTGEVSIAPIFDAAGDCVLLVGAVHDITERKRAEAEIAQLNEALERKVVERTTQLEDANRELEAFTYSVSHDLRAPVRTINGFTQILIESEARSLSEQGRRYLDLVREGAVRMGELIDNLLRLSRFARASLGRRRVDTAAMVADVVRSLDGEFAGRRVDFAIGDLPACYADAHLLRQVWLNLIANALKFTRGREPARIEIESATADGQVVYSVRDNGVGFDARYADKLFGVFQRLHRAEEYEGTGLGLAIVQRIVLRHGGWVRAEAKPGEGACFSFALGALPQAAASQEGKAVEAG